MDVSPDWWTDDERLLGELSAALASTDEVPKQILDAGAAAYAWRTIDDELAMLTYDSDLDDELLTHTRSSVANRTLVFAGDHLTVELEIVGPGLLGQLVPPQPAQVEVVGPGVGTRTTAADDIGRFLLTEVPRGPVRLHCRTADASVVTGWLRLGANPPPS